MGDVPDGTYTVAWKNVSTVDGHRVRGSFVFAVGQPLSAVPVQVEEQPLLQSPFSPLLRWLVLLGALAMAGGLVLELLVTRPVLLARGGLSALREAGAALSARSTRLAWLAAAVLLAGSVGQLLALVTIDLSLWGSVERPPLEYPVLHRMGEAVAVAGRGCSRLRRRAVRVAVRIGTMAARCPVAGIGLERRGLVDAGIDQSRRGHR